MPETPNQPDQLPIAQQKKGISRPVFVIGMAVMAAIGYVAGTNNDVIHGYLQGVAVSTDRLDLSSVQETYRNLKANFDGSLDTQKLIDGANRGMVAAAGDKFTVYMDATEAADFQDDLSGRVKGIGAGIGLRSDVPTITMVISGSPAEQAGLKAGDVITSINGDSTQGLSTDQVVMKIRGEVGTSVKLTILRDGTTKDYTITRADVNNPSVRSEVKNGVGILTITRFDNDTVSAAKKAVADFKAQQVKAVVLDLRDNGGGYADAGRDIAGLWLKDKTIFTTKHGDTTTTETSGNDAPLAGMKTIVLVNGNTASASEIVTGALHDYKVATLIGEKTFGKGSEQQVISLTNGAQLKVTIAKWYTPDGTNVNGTGITPDTVVDMTAADVNAGKDPQMDAAMAAAQQ